MPDDAPLPSLAPMVKRVAPTVVNVATRGSVTESSPANPLLADPAFNRFFDVPQARGGHSPQFQSAGSGVILDARKGYILTNAHVIENASEITVTLVDGRDLKADVVGIDEPTDIAVLQVRPVKLTQITLGDSARLEVGDFVVAIGNPFGLRNSVTSGIVSGLGRSSLDQDGFEDFIQTDAAINPGNSGGALVNLRGEMVGLATAILARSGGNIGIGFAIPVDMVRSIADQLEQFGSVKRGLLGVDTYPVSPDIAQALGLSGAQGALVTQVLLGSPAEQAGIHSGDIIISINHATVMVPADVRNAIGLLRAGDTADIELLRNGRAAPRPGPDHPAARNRGRCPGAACRHPPGPRRCDAGRQRGRRWRCGAQRRQRQSGRRRGHPQRRCDRRRQSVAGDQPAAAARSHR